MAFDFRIEQSVLCALELVQLEEKKKKWMRLLHSRPGWSGHGIGGELFHVFQVSCDAWMTTQMGLGFVLTLCNTDLRAPAFVPWRFR
jgi:hypothetical protein